jgi:hypothetical protein
MKRAVLAIVTAAILAIAGALVLDPIQAATTYNPREGDPCVLNVRLAAVINLTASGQLSTGVSGNQTYVCYLQFSLSATAENIALVEGTGTTCGTNTAGLAGGATAATGWNLLANGSVTSGNISNWAYHTATTGDNICLLASSTAQISGVMLYVQQ